MWFLNKKPVTPVYLTNTVSGVREEFRVKQKPVLMYSCGPTVYGPQHIGNLRSAVFYDTVARTLKAAGYTVKRVVNITDVGHLVGDGDEGEDKMAVGAKRDHTTPEAIAEKYTNRYLDDIRALNIDTNDITFPRATAYIQEQIKMIQTLERKGLTYQTSEGVYFDTAKFPEYGILGNVQHMKLQAGTRVELREKKDEHDFVLWRKAKPNDLQQWDSPWGKGNPGWSIECSAMATALLSPTIDIHTGGQDHIQVHHNNEIAQSEGASGKKPFAKYWLHNAFLTIDGEKISKSLGNTYTLDDVTARGIHPLALRYLFLQAHYRTPLSFTWESLAAADTALKRLWKLSRSLRGNGQNKSHVSLPAFNDLDTPSVLAALWKTLDTTTSMQKKRDAIEDAERIVGLSLTNPPEEEKMEIPHEIQVLVEKREQARNKKDFAQSDLLRTEIEIRGFQVEDRAEGPGISRKKKQRP
jgi:cysteinyl-tRNA synthetase